MVDREQSLLAALAERKRQHRYRQRRVLASPQGPRVRVDGGYLHNFCSNDYLGLAADARVIAALQDAAGEFGVGSGAAHLVNGHSHHHHALEEELAAATGRPRALLFSTGFMANLGVIGALVGRGDAVFEDRLNHASLLDGGLASGARVQRYRHNAVDDLATKVQRLSDKAQQSDNGRILIASDGVFSMDGDLAPIPALANLADQHDAWLLVDDAHGFGVLGEHGGGCCEQLGLDHRHVPILMGTLGKALGTFGAFVAGGDALIETLIQQARSYIYTTALPPAVAAATRVSLRLMQQESWRRDKLAELVARLRDGATARGLTLMPSSTPIQPLVVGDEGRALAASAALEARGFLVSAIRPPTVPAGSARLRITLSAAHELADVDALVAALAEVMAELDP